MQQKHISFNLIALHAIPLTEGYDRASESEHQNQIVHMCRMIFIYTHYMINSWIRVNFHKDFRRPFSPSGKKVNPRTRTLPVKPFPQDPWFLRPYKRRLLKTSWEKEKMLVTSIFSFFHNIFFFIKDINHYLSNIRFDVCKCFQYGQCLTCVVW